MQILQVPVVQSELPIPCATWVVSPRPGPPHAPTPLGHSWASPQQHSPFHIPKTCVRRGRREVPAPRDPTEHMGLPVAKSWAGATLGWFLLSCRVGASLDPSQQVANSQTPAQTPFEGSPHHPAPHLPQPGRDQCITYLHPSRSLSRSHPVIHCSRCLRTWPRFQCIPGPRTVP